MGFQHLLHKSPCLDMNHAESTTIARKVFDPRWETNLSGSYKGLCWSPFNDKGCLIAWKTITPGTLTAIVKILNVGVNTNYAPMIGMDSDRIRTDTNSDVTIYHILFQIRIRIRIQNKYFEFGITFEYLLDLQHRVITSINFICRWFYNWSE
jgi:hypothetical protein